MDCKNIPSFAALVIVSACLVPCAQSYMVGNNPYHQIEILDPQEKFQLEWLTDLQKKIIIFNVTVQTKGYVGFGLSSAGKMTGADIIIGGVTASGKPYFSDRHAVGEQLPIEDKSQDWTLLHASETAFHTCLSFSRPLDTCDRQDYPITEDTIALIWAYGEKDNEIEYHHGNRGVFRAYLLQPDYTPRITRHPISGEVVKVGDDFRTKVWSLKNSFELPSADTTYWCRMRKAPTLNTKHHAIGFEVRFANEASRVFTHHIILWKCHASAGRTARSMFEPFLSHRGQQCLSLANPGGGPIPTEYCTEAYHGWAAGARPTFNPPNVGFPFGESPDEYYVLQVHYNNPNQVSGAVVDLSVNLFYTSNLRERDGGMFVFHHGTPGLTPSFLLPPNSLNHRIHTICGSECTKEILPRQGIEIYSVLLHTHNTGRQIRFQHFRNKQELPWIASDDNYAFNFQSVRHLSQGHKILPGDQVTVRCIYDNTATNGTVVGGFGTQQEMCYTFAFYHNKIYGRSRCSSQTESEQYRQHFLGINNITWSTERIEYVVDPPHRLAGLTITEVSNNHVNWNLELRKDLDHFHRWHPHVNTCPRELFSIDPSTFVPTRGEIGEPVSFPDHVIPYQPKRSCSFY